MFVDPLLFGSVICFSRANSKLVHVFVCVWFVIDDKASLFAGLDAPMTRLSSVRSACGPSPCQYVGEKTDLLHNAEINSSMLPT